MLSELVNDTDNFCSRHAFGDVRHPLLESAEIVEDIVKNQIQHLVSETNWHRSTWQFPNDII
jgi:hypothetical protein